MKKKIKHSKYKAEVGITLVAVVISIIVLLILAGVTITMLFSGGIMDKAKEAVFSQKIAQYQEELELYLVAQYAGDLENFDRSQLEAKNIEEQQGNVLPIKKVIPSLTDQYCLERIQIVKGELAFTGFTEQEMEIIRRMVKSHKEESKPSEGTINQYIQPNVNPPIIPSQDQKLVAEEYQGICAVTYTPEGEKKIHTNLKEKWYNYEEQTGTTENGGSSQWANIETKDGSLWVWIPRFAYKITKGAHVKESYQDTNQLEEGEAGSIQVKFLKENTNEFWDGSQDKIVTDSSQITYTGTSQNEWYVHPAFQFGEKALTGFWMAKYEASSAEGNGNAIEKDNVLNTKTIQIKPGVSSWRYIETNFMFGNCVFMGAEHPEIYGFAPRTNTHLLKNKEWGACAYLAHSQYGRNGTRISINDSTDYITGTGGVLASTTGNAYGVFDMVGGASDAVAAVTNIDYVDTHFLGTGADISEYFEIYPMYNTSQRGDAIYETSIKFSNTTSWFSGLSWLVNANEPKMSRGGNAADGKNAGIFAFYRYTSYWYHVNRVSFRPVITPGEVDNPYITDEGNHDHP